MEPGTLTQLDPDYSRTQIQPEAEASGGFSLPTPLKIALWTLLWLFCLGLFTLLKFPQERYQRIIDGELRKALAPLGLSLNASSAELSFFPNVVYSLSKPVFTYTPPSYGGHARSENLSYDEMRISPSLWKLWRKKPAGAVRLQLGKGSLEIKIAMDPPSTHVQFEATKFDLGRSGLAPIFLGVQLEAQLDGKGALLGELGVPHTIKGNLQANLSQFLFPAQPLSGLPLPAIKMSQMQVELEFRSGKALLKSFRLGAPKSGPSANDDIRGEFTGEIQLEKFWGTSPLNVRAEFNVSETLFKAFPILENILSAGRQSAGGYLFNIGGSLGSPNPVPVVDPTLVPPPSPPSGH